MLKTGYTSLICQVLTLDGNLGFWGRIWGFGLNIAKYSRGGGFSSDWL